MAILESVAIVSIAKEVDALAGLAKCIISNLFLYYEAVRDAPKRSEELRQELASVCGLLDKLHIALSPSSKHPESSFVPPISLKNSIAHFRAMLENINKRVSVSKTKGFERLKWPFTREENERLLVNLERYKSTFNMALNIKCAYVFQEGQVSNV